MTLKTVKAQTFLKNGYVESKARNHKVVLDTPPNLGGQDNGMTPAELLLSAIGACQTLIARGYAKKFGINLKNFWVEVEGDIGPDKTSNHPDTPRFQEVRSTFHIETDSSKQNVSAYAEFIETHCPIGETVANAVNFKTAEVVIENAVIN